MPTASTITIVATIVAVRAGRCEGATPVRTSISAGPIYAERAQTLLQMSALVGYGIVIAIATAVCFSLADPIARVLGKTGINVMTRLMGLILAALAVEVMAVGLLKLFPGLGLGR